MTPVKALTEKMAKAQFLIKKDPLDCALFYLALEKKGPLLALFKAVNNTQLFQFFSNDFRKVYPPLHTSFALFWDFEREMISHSSPVGKLSNSSKEERIQVHARAPLQPGDSILLAGWPR